MLKYRPKVRNQYDNQTLKKKKNQKPLDLHNNNK